uniref:Uncharacterized protein n=1 Tax=Anguilla anguilla TaxID=7936 RepID=A0A0E9XKS2_ANGAN
MEARYFSPRRETAKSFGMIIMTSNGPGLSGPHGPFGVLYDWPFASCEVQCVTPPSSTVTPLYSSDAPCNAQCVTPL